MIQKSKVREIITKHKNCRKPHHIGDGVHLSCLLMVLAEVEGKKPIDIWDEFGECQ